MREIIFKRAEKREFSENARDSREMRETWQVCFAPPVHFSNPSAATARFVSNAVQKGVYFYCFCAIGCCV